MENANIEARIARATSLLVSLRDDVANYCTADPASFKMRFSTVFDPVSNVTKHSIYASANAFDPLFSIRAGEIVQHLRSALDHLVVAKSSLEGGGPSRKHQFPIVDTEADFEQQVRRGRLNGLPAKSIDWIKSIQPFNLADDPERKLVSPLAAIRDLSNRDKHNEILVGLNVIKPGSEVGIYADTLGGHKHGSPLEIVEMSPPFRGELGENEVEIFWIKASGYEPSLRIERVWNADIAIKINESDNWLQMIPFLNELVRTLRAIQMQF